MKLLVPVLKITASILPSLKKAIWPDGVFAPKRAAYVVIILTLLMIGTSYLGTDNMEKVVDQLDEVSDTIGYAE